jgi:hypothetical protein
MSALRLAGLGGRVAVFEKERLGSGASVANHGIVHSGALMAPLHPEVVPACRAALALYESHFPGAILPTRASWYYARPERMRVLRRAWREAGIEARPVAPDEARAMLEDATVAAVRVAAIQDLVLSPRRVVIDLADSCLSAGVRIYTGVRVRQVISRAGVVAAIETGRGEVVTVGGAVNCAGLGLAELIERSGARIEGRLRSRLDTMIACPNRGLDRPILAMEYDGPALAPSYASHALLSRYGGRQPWIERAGGWSVPIASTVDLLSEVRRSVREGLLDLDETSAYTCSKTELVGASADAWGVDPSCAVVCHDIANLWSVIPGKMTLAFEATRRVLSSIAGVDPGLALPDVRRSRREEAAGLVVAEPWAALDQEPPYWCSQAAQIGVMA